MSTEINCMNGESENDAGSTVLTSKSNANNNNSVPSTGTPNSAAKGQKSKKRRDSKTNNLLELFSEHQETVGSWADAAPENLFKYPPPPPQKSAPEPQVTVDNNQQPYAEWDERSGARNQWSRPGSERPPSVGVEARASHSRYLNTASVPDSPPFELFVTNINYKSTEEELYYIFGGEEGGVLEVFLNDAQGPAAKRGTATISFNSREALIAALQYDKTVQHFFFEQGGNEYYGTYPGANECGQYRSNSYAGMGSMGSAYTSSLPPRPRGSQPSSNYHGSSYTNYDTYGSRSERHPPYYDTRRNDFGNRSLRYPTNQMPSTYQQHQRYIRPYGGRHSMYESSCSQYRGSNYDISTRGRARTDSMASMPQAGTFHEEHHERRKLELQPRTKPVGDEGDNQPARKSSIFGEAKPVDTSEHERRLSSDYGYSRTPSYGKVTLMKSASHDGVHGMIAKQNSVVDEPLLEENSTPEVPHHRHPPLSSPHLPPRPPSRVSSFSSVPSTPSLEPSAAQRQPFSAAVPDFASTVPPLPPVTSSLNAPTNRGPSPARSFRSRSKDNVVDSSADTRASGAQQRSKHGYNRTFTRSSFRAHTHAKQPLPQQTYQSKSLAFSQRIQQESKEKNIETGHAGVASAAAVSGGGATGSSGQVAGRGGGASRRGGRRRGGSAASREKKRKASREQRKTSITGAGDEPQTIEQSAKKEEPMKGRDLVKQEDDVKKEDSTKKEEKSKFEDSKKESRNSKKEKKKQAAKEMPKAEPKSVNFSSRNKFAALLETDE
ncbi:hypothetical protein Tcan_17431 [Toxocara canis]|uniref:RRM domain-containing protein n=1 Tax=Toxocara canis TaxID=6265 RepID=A0A0B2V1T6_TOXCA|nr:hypothetical protein Tcan_17431 [Toxocara canis]